MALIVDHLLELVVLVFASMTWMVIKDWAGVAVMVSIALVGVFAVARVCSWLRHELPQPRGIGDGAIYCIGLLASIASVCAAVSSYAIGHAGEALSEAVSQFTHDCFSARSSAWQRSTLEMAAGRVVSLGGDNAKSAEVVLRGGMTLPVADAQAAALVVETYVKQAVQYFDDQRDWKYSLWSRWLPMDSTIMEERVAQAATTVGGGVTTISGDPIASPLTSKAVEAAGGIVSWFILAGIEEYLEVRQIELWTPALVLWGMTIALIWSTVRLRLDRGFARLSRMP